MSRRLIYEGHKVRKAVTTYAIRLLNYSRSLKTSALKLHEKMAQMSARIHDLEEALALLQASISAEPHPLLFGTDQGRSRSPIPVAAVNEQSHVVLDDSPDELTEALGSLAIRPFGDSQFHGETASSEVSRIDTYLVHRLSNPGIVLIAGEFIVARHC